MQVDVNAQTTSAEPYCGVTVQPTLEQRIRQIVREEIAAHVERLGLKSLELSINEFQKAISDVFASSQGVSGKYPLGDSMHGNYDADNPHLVVCGSDAASPAQSVRQQGGMTWQEAADKGLTWG